MKAKKRGPAYFDVRGHSAAFKRDIVWRVCVSENGITARRIVDGRELSIDWRTLLGSAMFYGHDSLRGEETKL